MSPVIEKYEEFDVATANETIGGHFDTPITSVEVRDLGEGVGLMSSIARAHLTLADGSEDTVVVKCVARTENRELSKGLNFYWNEVNFYKYLGAECPIPIPRSLYAEVDPSTQNFLLVLEDMGDAESGDQLVPCTEAQLRAAFVRAAELHARFWGRTGEHEWLKYQVDMRTMLFRRDAIFRPGLEPCINSYSRYFTGNRAEHVRKIVDQYLDLFMRAMAGEPTIVHGDYRTDNVFLVDRNGVADVVAFDWQNTMGGNGTHDIAYFSSQSAGHELRGETEMNILRDYHAALCEGGVKGYSFDECLEQYRYNLLITMITPIAICSTLDQGNGRGAQLGPTILERALVALDTFECADLLA